MSVRSETPWSGAAKVVFHRAKMPRSDLNADPFSPEAAAVVGRRLCRLGPVHESAYELESENKLELQSSENSWTPAETPALHEPSSTKPLALFSRLPPALFQCCAAFLHNKRVLSKSFK